MWIRRRQRWLEVGSWRRPSSWSSSRSDYFQFNGMETKKAFSNKNLSFKQQKLEAKWSQSDTNTEQWLRLTWSFSGLSEMSFRLLEVRFLWAVVGLSVGTETKGFTFTRIREKMRRRWRRRPRKDQRPRAFAPHAVPETLTAHSKTIWQKLAF